MSDGLTRQSGLPHKNELTLTHSVVPAFAEATEWVGDGLGAGTWE
jgi:hypothetical protein